MARSAADPRTWLQQATKDVWQAAVMVAALFEEDADALRGPVRPVLAAAHVGRRGPRKTTHLGLGEGTPVSTRGPLEVVSCFAAASQASPRIAAMSTGRTFMIVPAMGTVGPRPSRGSDPRTVSRPCPARLAAAFALAPVREFEPAPRLVRVHYDWLEAGEVAQRTVARLSEQLRRYLDDRA